MKLIKPGKPIEPWSKEFECTGKGNGGNGCRAILLVEEWDLYTTSSTIRDEKDTFVTFCCFCGKETDAKPPKDVTIHHNSKQAWIKWKQDCESSREDNDGK